MADFEVFVRTRGPALLRFAYLLTGDAHAAEDLVQEALARAHRRWSRKVRDGAPEAYVRRAILNQYLSWRRRRVSSEVAVADVPDRSVLPDDAAERLAARGDLWRQLSALPRMQRAVLVLRYYEDREDDEIAALLGCARATVRVHAARGLQRLRTSMPTTEPVMEG